MQEDYIYEVALSRIDGVGGVLYKLLVNTFGSAEAVFNSPSQKLLKVPGLGKVVLDKLKSNVEATKEAEIIVKDSFSKNIRIVGFKDPNYPLRLKGLFDSPPILYYKGNGTVEIPRMLAIVGTRDASEYGKESTDQIIQQLAKYKVQIVSGLAYGIDIAAHKAALNHGLSTIAVLANSLDTVYPSLHKKIANDLQETGLLISENPVGTKTVPSFFISRNRIIAGLSDVILVSESAKKGGSMVTAEFANNYNKEVFALPGGMNQKYSEGPNFLISSNKAQIFTSVDDFVVWMKWDTENNDVASKVKSTLDLNKFTQDESTVLSILMKQKDIIIDDLSWQSQIPLNRLASILLNLEFQDLVKQSPGKRFNIK